MINVVQLVVPLAIFAAGYAIQLYFYDQHIISLCIAVNFLAFILINAKAEESVDITTGMHSFWMFTKDMKLRLLSGKKMMLILVDIVN